LGLVPPNTVAYGVQRSKGALRVSIALLSGLPKPRCHLRVAPWDAFTICVKPSKIKRRLGLALIRRKVYRLDCYASAFQICKYLFKCLF
jgi:hypothetical protein